VIHVCSQLTWKSHSSHTHTEALFDLPYNPCSNFVSTRVMPQQAQIWSLSNSDVALWYERRQFIGRTRIHDTCFQPVDMKLTYTAHTDTCRLNVWQQVAVQTVEVTCSCSYRRTTTAEKTNGSAVILTDADRQWDHYSSVLSSCISSWIASLCQSKDAENCRTTGNPSENSTKCCAVNFRWPLKHTRCHSWDYNDEIDL